MSSGRSTRVLIQAEALRGNWKALAAAIPPAARILPMVKANGYGHGAPIIAQECARLGAAAAGVADIGEAMALRESGYRGEILAVGAICGRNLSEAAEHNIVVTLHTPEELDEAEAFVKSARRKLRAHLELETGMHRLGLEPSDWAAAAARLSRQNDIQTEGIFTHLAESEHSEKEFTENQLAAMEKAAGLFETVLKRRLIRHAANSGGILAHPRAHFDWVRPGIALYGYPPVRAAARFSPVLEWRAPIVQIKRIASGDSVGYNRRFRAKEAMLIGTVAAGYGDGYRRGYAGVGVGYRGRRCRTAGTISMDLMMIDLTGIPDPRILDEVTLIDPTVQAGPDAAELARSQETIPYEVLTEISARVPRTLVQP